MFHLPHFSSHPFRDGPCPRSAVALATVVLLALLGTSPATARAPGQAYQVPRAIVAASPEHPGSQVPVQVTPLLANWLDFVLNPIVSAINSRQRLIQVGALVMLLALTIIWWRK